MSKIVFRFRLTFEDVDDVERIFDVSGRNTFSQFHFAIQDAINFDRIKVASFYKANDLWRQGEEFCTEAKANTRSAEVAVLAKNIDDPYQKFLYRYDESGGDWHMRLEVIKLSKEQEGLEYPLLVKSIGASPKQYVDPKSLLTDPAAKLFSEADHLIKDLGELLAKDEELAEEDEDDEEEDEKDDFNLYGDEVDESEIK
ncbi:MAG: hypothetical protein JXR19_00480 [Bacteroidia bacterium]